MERYAEASMGKEFAGFAHDSPRFTVDCIKRDVSGIVQQNTFPQIVWQANLKHETFFLLKKIKMIYLAVLSLLADSGMFPHSFVLSVYNVKW